MGMVLLVVIEQHGGGARDLASVGDVRSEADTLQGHLVDGRDLLRLELVALDGRRGVGGGGAAAAIVRVERLHVAVSGIRVALRWEEMLCLVIQPLDNILLPKNYLWLEVDRVQWRDGGGGGGCLQRRRARVVLCGRWNLLDELVLPVLCGISRAGRGRLPGGIEGHRGLQRNQNTKKNRN